VPLDEEVDELLLDELDVVAPPDEEEELELDEDVVLAVVTEPLLELDEDAFEPPLLVDVDVDVLAEPPTPPPPVPLGTHVDPSKEGWQVKPATQPVSEQSPSSQRPSLPQVSLGPQSFGPWHAPTTYVEPWPWSSG
jgi:hypothetical protein